MVTIISYKEILEYLLVTKTELHCARVIYLYNKEVEILSNHLRSKLLNAPFALDYLCLLPAIPSVS